MYSGLAVKLSCILPFQDPSFGWAHEPCRIGQPSDRKTTRTVRVFQSWLDQEVTFSSRVQYPSGIAPNLPDQYILYNYQLPTGVLTSGDFHTYAVWWKDAQTLLFYFDGQLVRQTTPAGPFNEQSFMFFDTEVFGSEGLPSVADLTDPAKNTFYIDYVRAFKLQPKAL